ncbi:hypothetical protein Ahy_A07g034766 [Arachis hypogaea]|uniref:Retrotransposon gag domain-containing protein n=1 Tax=Arachis hypogaea TaxID=3818 RepID=A0A445CCN3_ARAHY|nr:hypothetical protein Ahy_A07g034766 [Arachis hypogaea]
MTENTRLQTLQAVVSHLTEQSEGYIEQFASITQTLASLQDQIAQHLEESLIRGPSSTVFGHLRQMKVDFPCFSGAEDVSQWIYHVECFFRIYDIPEDQRLDLVAVNLEGWALAWFQMWERLKPMADWLAISTALQMQFGLSHFENPWEELLKLKQSTTINAYFESFNDLAARAYGLGDALLLDCFMGGLHLELKQEDSAIEITEVHQTQPILAVDMVEPLHLSYNAMTGIPTRLRDKDIRILMDGGSFDNFIHPALLRRLAVPIHHSPRFKVEVGNGALLQCEGEVRDLPVSIQNQLLLISAFVLPIASEELVLSDI